MNILQKLSSKDYAGEWINVTLGNNEDRRFISPSSTFENPSGNAICLGNGESRSAYPLWRIGHTNKQKIPRFYNVVYGCNGVVREWHPDFLVVTKFSISSEVPEEKYNTTYAPQEIICKYPSMNLLPGCQRLDAGAASAYLAAFHGAKRVFLFGYDGQPEPNRNNNLYAGTESYPAPTDVTGDILWVNNLKNVVETYNTVEFFRVAVNPNDSYRTLTTLQNYQTIKLREFISLADL